MRQTGCSPLASRKSDRGGSFWRKAEIEADARELFDRLAPSRVHNAETKLAHDVSGVAREVQRWEGTVESDHTAAGG